MNEEALDEMWVRFSYHPPKPGQTESYTTIRKMAHEFALTISELAPKSREHSLAMTHLEQVVMWANAAIARRT